MRLKRLGILSALAILPAVAQVSDATAKAALLNAFGLRHGLIRIVSMDNTSVTSTNWSGYAVTGTEFTQADGSWIQPAITCNNENDTELLALWAGIDGFSSTTIEQTGTLAGCVDGQVSYAAWYEPYPKQEIVEIPGMIVSPGDKIGTRVVFDTNHFLLEIENATTGKRYRTPGAQPGTERSSAEWIAEAPCCLSSGAVYPMPNFGTANLGRDVTGILDTNAAFASSHYGFFATFPDVYAITMVNASTGVSEAVPSAPSSDANAFSIQWVSP